METIVEDKQLGGFVIYFNGRPYRYDDGEIVVFKTYDEADREIESIDLNERLNNTNGSELSNMFPDQDWE